MSTRTTICRLTSSEPTERTVGYHEASGQGERGERRAQFLSARMKIFSSPITEVPFVHESIIQETPGPRSPERFSLFEKMTDLPKSRRRLPGMNEIF